MEGILPEEKTMQLLTEDIPMERFVGAATTQAVVEGEVALPGGLREETRILGCDAMAVVDSCEPQSERLNIGGKVIFHVLYTQGDPTQISSLELSAEYAHTQEIEDCQGGQLAHASVMVEHVEAASQSGRLHLKSVLRVASRVLTSEPVSVVTGIGGVDGLMTKTRTLSTCLTAATGQTDALERSEFELSEVLQIKDTLYATAIATIQDVMGGEEEATISGEISLEVTHLSDMPSRPLVITRHTLPFEETLALTGERGDTITCEAVVKDVAVLSQADAEGARTLRAEVLLGLSARATAKRETAVLLDAYTTQGELLAPVQREVRRALSYSQLHTAESGKLTLLLEQGQPPARTPIKAFLRPVILGSEKQGGRLFIDGIMETTLLYMTDDSDVPVSLDREEPFRAVFACDLCDAESAILLPTNIDVSGITSDRVEVKYILHLYASDIQPAQDVLLTDVQRLPAQPAASGVVLYFTQPDDTLWDIAKRYRVSPDSLARMNPGLIAQEPFDEGTSVILWQR